MRHQLIFSLVLVLAMSAAYVKFQAKASGEGLKIERNISNIKIKDRNKDICTVVGTDSTTGNHSVYIGESENEGDITVACSKAFIKCREGNKRSGDEKGDTCQLAASIE